MRIGGRLLLVAGLALGAVLGVGAPALAHNALTGSDPADGDAVEQAPEEIRLEFMAAVDAGNAEFDVTGPGGESVMAGDAEVDEDTVLLPVRSGPAGDYQVAWRVLSSDGDWVDGTVDFTVTVGEQPSPSPSPSAPGPAAPNPSPVPAGPLVADTGDESGSGSARLTWGLVALAVAAVAGFIGYRFRRRAGEPS